MNQYREALSAALAEVWRRVPSASLRSVVTRCGTTPVREIGARDSRHVVVLLPAAGATSASWIGVLERCLTDECRALAVDPPGDAGSVCVGNGRLRSGAEAVEWLGAILDEFEVSAAHLVGHSFGAWLATQVALASPARVNQLTLLDPTAVVCLPRMGLILRALPSLVGLTRPDPASSRRALVRDLGESVSAVPDWWIDLAAIAAAAGPWCYPATPVPAPDRLRSCSVPTTAVLAGHSEVHDPADVARRFARRMPAARVLIAPNASHLSLPWDDSGLLREALMS